MAWEKSPEELAERFGRVMDRFADAVAAWVERAIAHGKTLPPKE